MASIDLQGFAQNGHDEISATSAEQGNWVAVQSDGGSATYSATMRNGDVLTSRARAEGIIVYGDIININITVGNVVAYRRIART